jgi:hypothetical protein
MNLTWKSILYEDRSSTALHEDPEDQGPYVGKAQTLHELGRQEELLAVYKQAQQRMLHPLAKARLLHLAVVLLITTGYSHASSVDWNRAYFSASPAP